MTLDTRAFRACLAALGAVLLLCGVLRRDPYLAVIGAGFLACAVVGDGRK